MKLIVIGKKNERFNRQITMSLEPIILLYISSLFQNFSEFPNIIPGSYLSPKWRERSFESKLPVSDTHQNGQSRTCLIQAIVEGLRIGTQTRQAHSLCSVKLKNICYRWDSIIRDQISHELDIPYHHIGIGIPSRAQDSLSGPGPGKGQLRYPHLDTEDCFVI